MADPGVPVEEHLGRVLALAEGVGSLPVVQLPLAEASGRVLAADVRAAIAVPRFDHAAMDGFAVRAADVAAVDGHGPVALPVARSVAAGDDAGDLPEGAAVRIMTGAPLPAGADLVVPLEWTDRGDPVQLREAVSAGRHIRRAGEDVAAGAVALCAGSRLGPARLGLLASTGCLEVPVHALPRVAVLATGAELASVRELADGSGSAAAVPNSNTITLVAAARSLGAEARTLPHAPDDPDAFRARLEAAAGQADLVVTTGGVSAGDHDVVKAALRDEPGFWFGPVAMKPGRPQGCGAVADGTGRRVPVLCLPGTPVAAYSSFLLYAAPAIRALAGLPPRRRSAPLAAPVQATDRVVLLPGRYDDRGRIGPLPGHAGHSQQLLALADALLVVPASGRLVPEGAPVQVLALHPEED